MRRCVWLATMLSCPRAGTPILYLRPPVEGTEYRSSELVARRSRFSRTLASQGDLRQVRHQSPNGYQAIGHTRMATERRHHQAFHPFSPAARPVLRAQRLFSNYFTVRRDSRREGVRFERTRHRSGGRLVALEMARGATWETRCDSCEDDGRVLTLLVSTQDQFAVVRDPFA